MRTYVSFLAGIAAACVAGISFTHCDAKTPVPLPSVGATVGPEELTILTECETGCVECPWAAKYPDYEIVSVEQEAGEHATSSWTRCFEGARFTIRMRRKKP